MYFLPDDSPDGRVHALRVAAGSEDGDAPAVVHPGLELHVRVAPATTGLKWAKLTPLALLSYRVFMH